MDNRIFRLNQGFSPHFRSWTTFAFSDKSVDPSR